MQIVRTMNLVEGKMYHISGSGGCPEMKTKLIRQFVGLNADGQPMFFDETMGDVVYRFDYWMFTQTPTVAQYA